MNIANEDLLKDKQLLNEALGISKKNTNEQLSKHITTLVKNIPLRVDKYIIEDRIFDLPDDQFLDMKKYMSEGAVVSILKENKEIKSQIDKCIKDMATNIMLDAATRCVNMKKDIFAKKQQDKDHKIAQKDKDKKQLQIDKILKVKEKLKASITSKQKADIKKAFGIEI
jgi:hypothetical protein